MLCVRHILTLTTNEKCFSSEVNKENCSEKRNISSAINYVYLCYIVSRSNGHLFIYLFRSVTTNVQCKVNSEKTFIVENNRYYLDTIILLVVFVTRYPLCGLY